jgi:uncharacterized damage-inducible protein DinB
MTAPLLDVSTKPAYVQETVALLGSRDPIEVMTETPQWLWEKLANLGPSAWTAPEAPGKWSLLQVICHLADAEMVFGWRTRLLLTADNAPITGYDQNSWLERFNYAAADPDEVLATFIALREWNLRVWRSVTAADLARTGIHTERGPESVALLRALIAGHDLRHRRQIDRLLAVGS